VLPNLAPNGQRPSSRGCNLHPCRTHYELFRNLTGHAPAPRAWPGSSAARCRRSRSPDSRAAGRPAACQYRHLQNSFMSQLWDSIGCAVEIHRRSAQIYLLPSLLRGWAVRAFARMHRAAICFDPSQCMQRPVDHETELTRAVHAEAKGAESVDAGAGPLGAVAVGVAQSGHPPLQAAGNMSFDRIPCIVLLSSEGTASSMCPVDSEMALIHPRAVPSPTPIFAVILRNYSLL